MRTKPLIKYFAAMILLSVTIAGYSETQRLNVGKLPHKRVYEIGELTPLAVDQEGHPKIVLLRIPAGKTIPPHAGTSATRLLTVLQGELTYADGKEINETLETVYPVGSILVIPGDQQHYAAAKNGEVLLQVTWVDPYQLSEPVKKQLQK